MPAPPAGPAPSTGYRFIGRTGKDQGAPAAIFLGLSADRAPHRIVEVLIVPLRETHRYAPGQASHGRAWYEIACDLAAMRKVRGSVYDPADKYVDDLAGGQGPMIHVSADHARYPDMIAHHACGDPGEGAQFADPLDAVAYARGGAGPE